MPVCGFFESISNQSFWQDYQQDYVVLLQCPPTCPPCYMGSDLDKSLKCLAWHISPQAWSVLYYQQTETPILWWSGEGQILTEATLTLFVYANMIYVDKMILHSDCGGSIYRVGVTFSAVQINLLTTKSEMFWFVIWKQLVALWK